MSSMELARAMVLRCLHVLNVQYGIGKGCGVALSTRVECPVRNWQGLWCCGILSTRVLNVQYRIGKGCGVALSTDVLNGRGREWLFVVNHFCLAEV